MLRRITETSAVWNQISSSVVVSDVSVGPNDEVFIIDKDGNVKEVVNDQIKETTFTNKNDSYGDNCRLAVSYEKELVIYVVDGNKDVYRITKDLDKDKRNRIYPPVYADDVSVGHNFHLFITSRSGIYRKRPNSEDLYLISNNAMASHIAVGKKTWVIGYDGFPYSAEHI